MLSHELTFGIAPDCTIVGMSTAIRSSHVPNYLLLGKTTQVGLNLPARRLGNLLNKMSTI